MDRHDIPKHQNWDAVPVGWVLPVDQDCFDEIDSEVSDEDEGTAVSHDLGIMFTLSLPPYRCKVSLGPGKSHINATSSSQIF